MPAPVAGIYVFLIGPESWMTGTNPAMTEVSQLRHCALNASRFFGSYIAG